VADSNPSRRDFISMSATGAFGAMIVPRHVLGGPGYTAPSDMLNVGIVGAGGMGGENATRISASEHLAAFCDVDFDFVENSIRDRAESDNPRRAEGGARLQAHYDAANKYEDFREMLAAESDLDAVVIATPDHSHAVIAAAAMRAGKHVYVQKPLAWSVHECRVLARLAEETGVVTQMGNQGHSSDDARLINEWIQAGVIGAVREVHIWTDRPIWPQGLPYPSEEAVLRDRADMTSWWPGDVRGMIADAIGGSFPQPERLNFDLWQGPAVWEHGFHPVFHPFHWRGWVPFGVGALGDMGAHLLDHPYWALDLGHPTAVEATSTPWGGGSDNPATYPGSMTVQYEFPRRGMMPPVELFWYDGGLMPKRPPELADDVELDRTGGVIYRGERGVLIHETYGRNPTLYPESLHAEADLVSPRYPRIEDENHEMNWVRACKGLEPATSPFSYAAPLTETMLLGLVALRAGQGRKIRWDAEAMRVTNDDDANRYLTREYRAGWEVA
jgi:predicted dehydrogenase